MAAAAPAIVMGVSAVASAVSGIASASAAAKASKKQSQIAQQNLQMQQQENEYQHQLQNTIMEREDNAIQRQVADSRAANISPLANMSGAQSSGAAGIQTSAPQNQDQVTPDERLASVFKGVTAMSGIVQTLAQLKNLNAQTAQTQANTDLANQQVGFNADSYLDRLNSLRLENALKGQEHVYNARTLDDRIKSQSLANRLASANIDLTNSNKRLADQQHSFNADSFNDRLNAIKYANYQTLAQTQALGDRHADFQREYNHRVHAGIYASDPVSFREPMGFLGAFSQILGGKDYDAPAAGLGRTIQSLGEGLQKMSNKALQAIDDMEQKKKDRENGGRHR